MHLSSQSHHLEPTFILIISYESQNCRGRDLELYDYRENLLKNLAADILFFSFFWANISHDFPLSQPLDVLLHTSTGNGTGQVGRIVYLHSTDWAGAYNGVWFWYQGRRESQN